MATPAVHGSLGKFLRKTTWEVKEQPVPPMKVAGFHERVTNDTDKLFRIIGIGRSNDKFMCSEFWPRDVRTMGIKMAPLNRDLIDSLHPILEVVLFFLFCALYLARVITRSAELDCALSPGLECGRKLRSSGSPGNRISYFPRMRFRPCRSSYCTEYGV